MNYLHKFKIGKIIINTIITNRIRLKVMISLMLHIKYTGGVIMEIEILNEVLSKLNNIESHISSLKNDVSELKNDVNILKRDVISLKQCKNTFEDEITTKPEDGKTLEDRLEFVEKSLSHTTKTVSNLSDVIEILKTETGKNSIDIKILSHKLNKKHNG